MRIDEKNVVPTVEPEQKHQALKFFFTPVDAPVAGRANPLAKATTRYPEVVEALRRRFGDDITRDEEYAGEQTVYVRKAIIADVCRYLKEELSFLYLSDLGGLDRFVDDDRFEIFYNLVSFERQKRIRLKVRVDESELSVPSVTHVYRSANWNEREVLDMFGIRFEGHSDLRRIYMPEDFEYYPLRKEFPLLGIPGSLPLPPQTPEGDLQFDPFPAAHGSKTPKSYEEPESK
ncbi:MAG: NADH-quinone oxidoreductase subunit C, partial [Rhodothermales bacterium]